MILIYPKNVTLTVKCLKYSWLINTITFFLSSFLLIGQVGLKLF